MTDHPRVSLLVTDVSLPALGHVIDLARLLQPHVPVEVVGPDLGKGISPMYEDAWPVVSVSCPRMYRWPEWPGEARKLMAACQGEVIVADKAFANTLGVALMAKRQQGKRVVAFLDEWDGAVLSAQSVGQRMADKIRHLYHPLEGCWFDRWERKLGKADLVISTTRFLQQRFGGEHLAMGADCQLFQPGDPAAARELRRQLGLTDVPLVVFGGVARAHKGVEEILHALPDEAHLLIVGPETETVGALKSHPEKGGRVHCTGAVPKERMPAYLDLADVIALPLRNTRLGQSQMPCKVYEALAMGKPVVATAVSDLPEVLEGCGTVYRAGDEEALHGAMQAYLNQPLLASRHRAAARAKALREYDHRRISQRLWEMIRNLL